MFQTHLAPDKGKTVREDDEHRAPKVWRLKEGLSIDEEGEENTANLEEDVHDIDIELLPDQRARRSGKEQRREEIVINKETTRRMRRRGSREGETQTEGVSAPRVRRRRRSGRPMRRAGC